METVLAARRPGTVAVPDARAVARAFLLALVIYAVAGLAFGFWHKPPQALALGAILIAESQRGICAILLGDDPTALIIELQNRFPQAELLGGDPDFEQRIASVIGFIEAPQLGLDLPLDIRGTAFQQRVWQALREIPVGSTASYADIASKIGAPKSVRAVAGACAANGSHHPQRCRRCLVRVRQV